MTTYVLMHGGGMGGWVWKYVAPQLRKAGHDVYTPTFTGFGERIHLIGRDVAQATHVTDIVNVLEFEELSDVVLVAHSYAGSVAPGIEAKAGDRIRRHVLFDSVITEAGEAVAVAMGMVPAEQAKQLETMLKAGEGPLGSGVAEMQREAVRTGAETLSMPDDRKTWLLGHLSDMPLACTMFPVEVGASSIKKPVDYVAASDTVMKPMHARARKLPWTVHELEGDHSFLVGQPEWTTQFLLKFA